MPYPVQNLLLDRGKPITASPQDKVSTAIEVMQQYDFSQLPVVDKAYRPLGMVTYQSIVEALGNFGTSIDKLLVSHAIVKTDRFSPDDDLFDLLDRLQDKYAVLVTDRDNQLLGIVTTYDSTEYFRRRGEDMMFVEDIESMIRDLIAYAHHVDEGAEESASLLQAMQKVFGNEDDTRSRFRSAVEHYVSQVFPTHTTKTNNAVLNASYTIAHSPKAAKEFNQLTLGQYVKLLLHDSSWKTYKDIAQIDVKAVNNLLQNVCTTRNQLAHFRGEPTAIKRAQLRSCWTWLQQIQEAAMTKEMPAAALPEEADGLPDIDGATSHLPAQIEQYEDESATTESKYAELALFLQSQPGRQDRVHLSFESIEKLIGATLPPSARSHRAWWANDTVGHIQSQLWLEAGWRVAQISMTEERVTFARIREREKAYIDFFAQMLADIKEDDNHAVSVSSPDGQSWLQLASVDASLSGLAYVVAFTRFKNFRIEVYIDTGERERNKYIFDGLLRQRQAIETTLDAELSWERLDGKRASRIAWYHDGTIQDNDEKLSILRSWVVDALPRFRAVMDQAVQSLEGVE